MTGLSKVMTSFRWVNNTCDNMEKEGGERREKRLWEWRGGEREETDRIFNKPFHEQNNFRVNKTCISAKCVEM
jgi:hypothetical protein